MKGCRWMTYHLTVHTVSIPMSKKTNELCLNYGLRLVCNSMQLKSFVQIH